MMRVLILALSGCLVAGCASLRAPAPVEVMRGQEEGDMIRLLWNASISHNVTGYEVMWTGMRPGSGTYSQATIGCEVQIEVNPGPYMFSVRAVSPHGVSGVASLMWWVDNVSVHVGFDTSTGDIVVRWDGAAGAQYVLQHAEDGFNWQDLELVNCDAAGMIIYVVSNRVHDDMFRVLSRPQARSTRTPRKHGRLDVKRMAA